MKKIILNKYFLLFLFVASAGALIYFVYRSKKLKEQRKQTIEAVEEAINTGAGVETKNDANSVLLNVKPDTGYTSKANSDADVLHKAISWYNDDEEAVFKVLTGKTKAQLKTIEIALRNKYGYNGFEAYLDKIFDQRVTLPLVGCVDFDCQNYDKAMRIISSSK